MSLLADLGISGPCFAISFLRLTSSSVLYKSDRSFLQVWRYGMEMNLMTMTLNLKLARVPEAE